MKGVIIVILIFFLVFLVSQLWYFYGESGAAEVELNKLKAELDQARRDREALTADYEFYLNPKNLEKELRARFNYRLPGEKLIIIVPPQASSSPR
jgi:hypothetical protein